MEQEYHIVFGPFRLEMPNGRLWQDADVIALRPRSLVVLRYLVTHPGCLVTKTELRQHVWAETHVTDTVLRVCVREIRVVLGDAAAAPQYLETVGTHGYRFRVPGDSSGPPLSATGPIVGRQGTIDILDG
jgi:DNA-binding winged helix-turn-helix (wHTH) protein